jgi:hypothetical protein
MKVERVDWIVGFEKDNLRKRLRRFLSLELDKLRRILLYIIFSVIDAVKVQG